jgi:hypothetical protein
LAEIASLLGGAGINLESISAESLSEGAVIRLITKDAKTAKRVLDRAGHHTTVSDVLVLEILDRPGELGKVSTKLARQGIDIENIYLISRAQKKTRLALKVDRLEKAEELFGSSRP